MLSVQEKEDILAAVELLRRAALASYETANADRPLPDEPHETTVHGMPRYLVFMVCENAMLYLMRRVWFEDNGLFCLECGHPIDEGSPFDLDLCQACEDAQPPDTSVGD